MKLWYIVTLTVVLLTGCNKIQPVIPCQPTFIPQKCKTSMPSEPQWSDENVVDRVDYLRAKIENSGKHKSYEYDLKAALNKCL
jgi:hypothetical protein